ncbi:MAG TPA: MBL fold metallo-hydrolase [Solirubrobacteraceae bacterium]|nr:MBL fold metallo-hydrolase [Solirubrobacteraceae bacterium]
MAWEENTAEFAALAAQEEAARAEHPARPEQADEAEAVARGYFSALERGERTAQRDWYHPEMEGTIHGVVGPAGRDELVAWFDELYAAFPDFRFQVLDLVADGHHAAVRWRAQGTFAGPGRFNGMAPTGAAVDMEGTDLLWPREGKVGRILAYTDGMSLARQLGALPAQGSAAEAGLTAALNVKTGVTARLGGSREAEEVADGVWRVQGGWPGHCNVYMLRDAARGSVMFDAGGRYMTKQVRAAAARMGGLERIVLGHGHTDHRGTAPAFPDVPVHCHPDEVADAEGTGGWRYWEVDKLPWVHREAHTRVLHPHVWDGGPVRIAGTVEEGDTVAGFQVIHIPGHAPGLIALWRERDRVLLCSDAFYTLDLWGRAQEPALPFEAYNLDTEQARDSLRRLAALEPAVAFPGHAAPARGDVRGALDLAARSG